MLRFTIALGLGLALAAAPVVADDGATPTDPAKNPVVMKVNGEPVRAADVSMVMLNVRGAIEQAGQSTTQQQLLEIATQRVLEQKLLAQEARRYGLTPDADMVARLLAAAESQAGGREHLESNLAAAGATVAELEAMLGEMSLAQQFIKRQIEPTVPVSEQDVERYYADHADRFTVDERIRPRHIVFAVPPGADDATVARIRDKAVAARQRVMAGEPFADVARDVSEGPSAARGGDLGLVPPDAMEPEFAAVAMALAPGEVSDVVRTSYGFHVITVDEHREAGVLPLAEVHDTIVTQLRQPKVAATVADLLKTLAEKARVEVVQEGAAAAPTPAG